MPLDAATSSKLIKLLGMLGSAHDGEVAAAGRAAHRLLQAQGLTWADVIAVQPEPRPGEWREPVNWQDAVFIALAMDPSPLSAWDYQFLRGIAKQSSLSDRQRKQLDRIVSTCRLFASVAA